MAYFKVKVLFPASMFEARRLVKLGRFSGHELALPSWWSILSEKLAVSGIMDLVADMSTDVKREISPNTLVIPFPLLSFFKFFWFFLILKCGGLHILGLGGSTVKVWCDLLHLEKPALLCLG